MVRLKPYITDIESYLLERTRNMKKIIKLPIESTTQIRKTEDSLCELYSHDKNNGLFEFEVTNVKLGNEKPYAMFKFMDSLSVWKVLGTIEDNKIKVAFDTSLITKDETVVCFLYLDDEERTTDFYRFKFKVKVSEIDKINTYAVKERYFNNSIIVDKVDVVTKDELKEALKGLTVSTVEGVLTETRADEIYAKKTDIPQPYDDSALRQKVATLEERPDNNTVYDDTDLRERVVALESKSDKDTVYDDTDLKRRVSELENRPDNNTVYDDSDLRGRVEALESKPDNNTVYDDTDVKERLTALETKEDKDTKYDDSDIKERLTVLENKPDNNTVYDDTNLSNRVKALEDAPKVDVTNFATKDDVVAFNRELNNKVSSVDFEAFKTTIPQAYNDSELSKRVTALENKPSTGGAVTSATSSEIRGTGMPNGVVEAPIGATYIDTAKTNGALKWIKTTDGGNEGWKVVEGDTGWITIFTKNISIDNKLSLKIRRINNMVNVLFEGEFVGEAFIKTFYDNNFSNKKLMANGKITDGFKPASEISVPAHVEKNNNEGFQDAGAFLFDIQNNTFEIILFTTYTLYRDITDGLANINFNYVTYEEWPTELPAQN